jgi:fibronectin type 3 domain-containing protein
MQVTFTAPASGTLTGSITVTSNATNSPARISLSGAGVQQAVLHSVALAWTPETPAVAGYNLYRSTVSGGPYVKVSSPTGASASYTDAAALGGQVYYYVLTAVDSSGIESLPSNETAATTPIP